MSKFSLKALGDDSPLPLPSFAWLLAILSIPWFADASCQPLPLSSRGNLYVCLYAIFPLCRWIFISSYDILPFMWMYINFLIFKNTGYWTVAYLSWGWSHLSSITSAKTEFLNMFTFTDARIPTYFLGKQKCRCSVMSSSLRPHGLWPVRLLCTWDFLGKNTEVGCHSLLQGMFPR